MTGDDGLPDGDLYAFSDELLLVDEWTVMTLAGIKVGEPGVQPMISLALSGRYNRTEKRETVTVALAPDAMADLVRTIADSYAAARLPRRGSFGDPQ